MTRSCPCENGMPDPCPRCGATVSGNDPMNGVCQASKLDAVMVTDDMVARAHAEYHRVLGSPDRSDPMRAALHAALLANNSNREQSRT